MIRAKISYYPGDRSISKDLKFPPVEKESWRGRSMALANMKPRGSWGYTTSQL